MTKWIQLTKEDLIELETLKLSERLRKKVDRALTPTKIRSNKNKGKALQNDTCEALANYLGVPFSNTDDDAPIASRPMGQHGEDIILRGEAAKRLPFSFECKNTESLSIIPVIEQASANTKEGKDWVIVHRKRALKKDIVILAFDTFMKMLKKGNY